MLAIRHPPRSRGATLRKPSVGALPSLACEPCTGLLLDLDELRSASTRHTSATDILWPPLPLPLLPPLVPTPSCLTIPPRSPEAWRPSQAFRRVS